MTVNRKIFIGGLSYGTDDGETGSFAEVEPFLFFFFVASRLRLLYTTNEIMLLLIIVLALPWI
jgi:hypothetical protein